MRWASCPPYQLVPAALHFEVIVDRLVGHTDWFMARALDGENKVVSWANGIHFLHTLVSKFSEVSSQRAEVVASVWLCLYVCTCVQYAREAIEKYPTPGRLNHRSYCYHGSSSWTSETLVLAGLVPSKGVRENVLRHLFLTCRWSSLCSHSVSLCVCLHIPPSVPHF